MASMILTLASKEKNVPQANNNGLLIPTKDALDDAERGRVIEVEVSSLGGG